MNGLVLYVGELARLPEATVCAAIRSLPGARVLPEGDAGGTILGATFDAAGDSTIVRLSGDRETIVISGAGDASLVAAWELRQRTGLPFRVVDWDYSFDLDITQFPTFDDFKAAVGRGRGR